jgi:hypothetical protein
MRMRPSAIVSVLALALAAASVAACSDTPASSAGEPVSAADAVDVLESTPWLDTMPRTERSVINAYLFTGGDGAFLIGNSYKMTIEMFVYEATNKTLELEFLDENKSYGTAYTIERYKGEAFDYKLTLKKSPRGPKVYYGFDNDQGDRAVPAVVSKIKALSGGL